MKSLERHIVKSDDLPTRLLDYCIGKLQIITSRAGIKKALKREDIILNGLTAAGGIWLKENDVVELKEPKSSNHKIFPLKLEIIYEDEFIAVIEKPAGYEVSGNKYKTIQNALNFNLMPSQANDALSRPVPVHRLDYGTSGLLIIAKTHAAAVNLGQQFEEKKVKKTYHALANGQSQAEGTITIDIDNKKAVTHFNTIKTVNSLVAGKISLLQLFPISGRKHQLRIHLSGIGHPIVGDKDYSEGFHLLRGKGMFLCATSIRFYHPVKQDIMEFKIDIPKKFTSLLKREEERFKKLG